MLTVYIDFQSAASYLALAPTLALSKRLHTTVNWQPFVSWERELPEDRVGDTVTARHQQVRMRARRRVFQRYAKVQGLGLTFRDDPGSADLALGVLALHPELGDTFVGKAFAAYWQHDANLNDLDDVKSLLPVGAPTIDEAAARSALDLAQSAAEAQGVVDTPAYVIDGQVFVGREHLPWIEELLTDG